MTRLTFVLMVALSLGLSGCAAVPVEEQMGSQSFDEPSVAVAGGADEDILLAVQAAVDVADRYKFRYDASGSANGRVIVTALWKGRPVTLTLRFFRREGNIYIASNLSQPGDVFLEGGGQRLEQLYYSNLAAETARRGLVVYGDPNAEP